MTLPNNMASLESDWVSSTLGNICYSITDGTHYTPKYVNQGIPFYSVENVTANDFTNTKYITEDEHQRLIKRCKPEKGDILMTRIGSIGGTRLIDWDVNASIYVSLALLKLNNEIDSEYFYQYSKSDFFTDEVYKKSLLNAIPMKINMDAISNVEIRFPRSKAEQKAIAKALADIDELISELSISIMKKENLFTGLLQKMFQQSSECSPVAIGTICDIQKGSATWYSKELGNGEYGFLNGGIDFSGFTTSFNDPGDTVVVSEGGNSCGFVNYIKSPFWCGGHAYRLLNFLGIQKYLYFAMKSKESEIMNLRVGSGLPNVQKRNLAEFEINVHGQSSRQKDIAEFLDVASEEILTLKQEKTKYKYIKQGMMNDLLTGKVRLV